MNVKKLLIFVVAGLFVVGYILSPIKVAAITAKAPDGSKIAGVSISGKTNLEAKEQLRMAVDAWQEKDPLQLKGENESYTIPREQIQFDIGKTVEQFKEETKRDLFSLFMRPKNIHLPLVVHVNEQAPIIQALIEREDIKGDQLTENIAHIASQLRDDFIAITYKGDQKTPTKIISEIEMNIPNGMMDELQKASTRLNRYIIEPEGTFDFFETAVVPERVLGQKDAWDFLGSALYKVFLQAGFEVIERHAQEEIPDYTEPGIEVALNGTTDKNLIVRNRDLQAYKMDMNIDESTLYIELEAVKRLGNYEYQIVNKEEIKARTLYRYNKYMDPGEEKVLQSGEPGLRLEVERTASGDAMENGTETISREVYLPAPKIVMVSTLDEEKEGSGSAGEEELPSEGTESVEHEIEDLKDQLDEQQEFVDDIPIEEGSPTLTKQLKKIKETQAEMKERLLSLELLLEGLDENTEKEISDIKEKYDEKLETMLKQIEKLEKKTTDKQLENSKVRFR